MVADQDRDQFQVCLRSALRDLNCLTVAQAVAPGHDDLGRAGKIERSRPTLLRFWQDMEARLAALDDEHPEVLAAPHQQFARDMGNRVAPDNAPLGAGQGLFLDKGQARLTRTGCTIDRRRDALQPDRQAAGLSGERDRLRLFQRTGITRRYLGRDFDALGVRPGCRAAYRLWPVRRPDRCVREQWP